MAYASASDVVVRWGKSEVDDELQAQINVRLEDVERMIGRRVAIDTGSTRWTFHGEDVIKIEPDAVVRLDRNPGG